MAIRSLLPLLLAAFLLEGVFSLTFSSKLMHRYSDESKTLWVSRSKNASVESWPQRNSSEYFRLLLSSDLTRQRMKLGSQYESLYPSEGSETLYFGNEFDCCIQGNRCDITSGSGLAAVTAGSRWIATDSPSNAGGLWNWTALSSYCTCSDCSRLHYTWIDIGTPNVSFLVALDAGSDLLWVPCDCIECAPLSAGSYDVLDRDLSEYSPSLSSTSRHLPCSHQLCDQSTICRAPKEPCPYNFKYRSENTSSSGFLIEDKLHLATDGRHVKQSSVQASIILGCGRKQSGDYLDGAAPDGVLGLGPGSISVPSLLAKAGLIHNSFSICFNDNGSGRILFGDQGSANQQSTPFLQIDGKFTAYVVGVESFCAGNSCFKQTEILALIDSGTSFTYLPNEIYKRLVLEFDKQVKATRIILQHYPWEYCYNASSRESSNIPVMRLTFAKNQTFQINNPVYAFPTSQEYTVFCLNVMQTDDDYVTIGQNFLMDYRMVFDRENLRFGWSSSNCKDIGEDRVNFTAPNDGSRNPLPANQQQSAPNTHAVPPAVAGKASPKPSMATLRPIPPWHLLSSLSLTCLFLFWF